MQAFQLGKNLGACIRVCPRSVVFPLEELRAEGNELSNEIRSTADKEKVIILAEAYKTSEQIRGDGDATAAAIYAESFSGDPEFYEFTRSMKAYDATFNNKSDVLLIDPKSDFFKYLNKSKGDN